MEKETEQIIKNAANGKNVEPRQEPNYDWADEDTLSKIKDNFGEVQRPRLWT
jgi:hypothetical protein